MRLRVQSCLLSSLQDAGKIVVAAVACPSCGWAASPPFCRLLWVQLLLFRSGLSELRVLKHIALPHNVLAWYVWSGRGSGLCVWFRTTGGKHGTQLARKDCIVCGTSAYLIDHSFSESLSTCQHTTATLDLPEAPTSSPAPDRGGNKVGLSLLKAHVACQGETAAFLHCSALCGIASCNAFMNAHCYSSLCIAINVFYGCCVLAFLLGSKELAASALLSRLVSPSTRLTLGCAVRAPIAADCTELQ